MTQREKWCWRATMMLCFALALWGSGIVPAIIPISAPAANRRGSTAGNGIFQLANSTSATTANCAQFDSNGSIADSGSPCGSAAAGGGMIVYSATTISLSGTLFYPPGGGASGSASESNVEGVAPSSATISAFAVELSAAVGGGNSVAYTWRKNGADQSVTCTISGGSSTSCSDTIHSFAVAQGDLVDVKAVATGTIIVTPITVITTLWGTTGSSGTINTATGGLAYYAASGTTLSGLPGSTAIVSTEGNGTKVQAFTGSDPTTNNCAKFDANHNITDAGTTCGGSSVSVSNGYLTVGGTVYCGGMIATCTIPPSTSWTFANQGSSTVTGGATTPLFFFWQNAGGADNLRDYHRTAPGTFTVIAAFYSSYAEAVTATCNGQGITVGDGTKFISFGMTNFDCQAVGARITLQKWNTTTSADGAYNQWESGTFGGVSPRLGSGLVWQKLVLDSTNLTWSISLDGINYIQFDQRAKGDFLGTITTVGVGSYVPGDGHMSLVSWSGA